MSFLEQLQSTLITERNDVSYSNTVQKITNTIVSFLGFP